MVDISIIIVNWNTQTYLRTCLESIQATARGLQVQIIVVDNASSDDSVKMVKRDFPRVLLLPQQDNLGFAAGNNEGIRFATGRHLFFINSDVKVLDGCIEQLYALLESRPQTGLAGPRILDRNGSTQRSCMSRPTLWNTFCRTVYLDKLLPHWSLFSSLLLGHWNHDTQRQVEVINGCFWAARREAIDVVGPLDERFFMYGEDVDWCTRFAQAGWEILFHPQAQAIHYGGASSAKAPQRFYVQLYRAKLQYWQKHHSRLSTKAYRVLLLLHHTLRVAPQLIGRNSSAPDESLDKRLACIKALAR
jgi:GT2 family glycosyltransferase